MFDLRFVLHNWLVCLLFSYMLELSFPACVETRRRVSTYKHESVGTINRTIALLNIPNKIVTKSAPLSIVTQAIYLQIFFAHCVEIVTKSASLSILTQAFYLQIFFVTICGTCDQTGLTLDRNSNLLFTKIFCHNVRKLWPNRPQSRL